jgi:hypothetical protein
VLAEYAELPWQQTPKLRVSQSSIPSPFNEFHFARLFRLRPNAFRHHFLCKRVLMFARLLRQIPERASFSFQVLNRIVDLSTIEFIQTCD